MNDSVLAVLVAGALVIVGVIVYNMYREAQYRKQLRDYFGEGGKDALMAAQAASVRDGRTASEGENAEAPLRRRTVLPEDASVLPSDENGVNEPALPVTDAEPLLQPEETAVTANRFGFEKLRQSLPFSEQGNGRKLLLDVEDMAVQPLPWFDKRFDYTVAVALHEPKELHAMPRLSSKHRFRLIGCTMDGRYQEAEPIPGVYYRGFVAGLQAVSRSGLASREELDRFVGMVGKFAEQTDGAVRPDDADAFLEVARPLDELCARVDQTIAIHLVSRSTVSGVELRKCVAEQGFELSHDGAFYRYDDQGDVLFSIVTLDNSPFTATLLDNKSYRGFSMLFELVLVPAGEKHFNIFMDVAVSLSGQLGLDLVNDKVEELSTQWLKEVRRYVVERQHEMKEVGIDPGSSLAKRIFS